MLSGWLSANRDCYALVDGKINWRRNPLELLADTYNFLDMNHRQGRPAAEIIWDHDNELLQSGLAFYAELKRRLDLQDWGESQILLAGEKTPRGFSGRLWKQVRAAHAGFQSGLDILAVLPFIAETTGFYELDINDDLTINIPERLLNEELGRRMTRVLAPPPVAGANEILAESGGMFYPRESPEHEVFVQRGSHFETGDPLYIVEVMKMFNKVHARFSGAIDEVLVEGEGVIISKGQPLYRITPDEAPVVESADDLRDRRQGFSKEFLAHRYGGKPDDYSA